jgi:hypothetical protein
MATRLSLPAAGGGFRRGSLLRLLGRLLLSGLRGSLLRLLGRLLLSGLRGSLLRLLGRLLLGGLRRPLLRLLRGLVLSGGLRGALLRLLRGLLLRGGLRGALLSLLRPLLTSGGLCSRTLLGLLLCGLLAGSGFASSTLLGLLSRCRFGSGSLLSLLRLLLPSGLGRGALLCLLSLLLRRVVRRRGALRRCSGWRRMPMLAGLRRLLRGFRRGAVGVWLQRRRRRRLSVLAGLRIVPSPGRTGGFGRGRRMPARSGRRDRRCRRVRLSGLPRLLG